MIVFLWEGLPYIIESFDVEGLRVDVLRSTSASKEKERVPPFLKVDKEVTEDDKYFTRNLGK